MYKTFLFIFIFLLFFSSSVLYTGDIAGTVKDKNGKALPGIFVSARDTVKRITTTVVTNKGGNYFIERLMPGTYMIEANQVGYVPHTVRRYIGSAIRQTIDFALDEKLMIEDQLPSSSHMVYLPDGE